MTAGHLPCHAPRLGPPRLEYYVVPLPDGANVPRPSSSDDGYSLVTSFWVSFGIVFVGVLLDIFCAVCCGPANDEEEARSGSGGGAVPTKTGGSTQARCSVPLQMIEA